MLLTYQGFLNLLEWQMLLMTVEDRMLMLYKVKGATKCEAEQVYGHWKTLPSLHGSSQYCVTP